jgi:single-strand DNA-binding protein
MASLNKTIHIGNLTADPELKQTQDGTSVCSFNIAVNRYSKEPDAKKVDFLTVVAWGPKAEFVSRYFKKGQAIVVCGRLENREWTDKQGNKRISTEIIAEEISFAGNKENTTEAKNEPYVPSAYSTENSQNFEEIPGDEQLPF